MNPKSPILHEITTALERKMSQAGSHRTVIRALNDVLAKTQEQLDDESWDALQNYVTNCEVNLLWAPSAHKKRRVHALHRPVHPLEIAMAFSERAYVCFATALYWNGLTDQVPTNFFVGIERKSPTHPTYVEGIDQFYLREQFMKPYRETSRVAVWQGNRFTLFERDFTNLVGVAQRRISVGSRTIRYACTNVERTLVDCTIFPNRGGGIATVLHCYAEGRNRITVARLNRVYREMNLTYPYWQRIGFMLSATGQVRKARDWRALFGEPEFDFYLDKPYQSGWILNHDWRIYHPPELRS